MTLEDSIQGFRLRVLTDATRSGNVTATCARFGVSRTWFYRLRARLERYGPDGLHPKRRLARRGRPSLVSVVVRAPGRREGAGVADARPAVGQRSARVRWRVGRPGHGVAGLASSRVEHGGRAAGGAGAAQCRHEGNLDRADPAAPSTGPACSGEPARRAGVDGFVLCGQASRASGRSGS